MNDRLPRLSASKITTYKQCPSWYAAQYIHSMPTGKNTYGLLGTALHSAIERQYKYGEIAHYVFQDVINSTLHAWDNAREEYTGYDYSTMMKTGFDILDTFDYSIYTPLDMEVDFLVPFPALKTICNIRGFIDVVTTDNKIVDYKSGRAKPSKKDVDNSLQLLIYYYAYTQLYNKSPSAVILHHLRTQKQIPFDMSNVDTQLEELENVIKEIIALDVTEPKQCSKCNLFCPLHRKGG